MKVVTAREMQSIDRETIETYGISGELLMERAGVSVVEHCLRLFQNNRHFLILCGPGNNGGDGLVVARELKNRGLRVSTLLLADSSKLKGDALINYKRALKYGVDIRDIKDLSELPPFVNDHDTVIVDALFGTGLVRPLEGLYAHTVDFINQLAVPVISIDMPSGVCSDTGRVMGTAVKAHYTFTFGCPKYGHFIHPGAEHTGRLLVSDIGFPKQLIDKTAKGCLIDHQLVSPLVPQRPVNSSKRDYGHVLLIAGSIGKTGAALLTARAAMRTGCGLLTLAMPESALRSVLPAIVEEMTFPIAEDQDGRLSLRALEQLSDFIKKRATAIAIGPGIGMSEEIIEFLRRLIALSKVPLVIDADGLNALSRLHPSETLEASGCQVVVTPHEGEMCRLVGVNKIEDRLKIAREFAQDTKAVTVLKGSPTLIANSQGELYINTKGNPGMATGGSGDVLTGIIVSLLAQGLDTLQASLLGVYLHSLAGDRALRHKGMHSLIASDIIDSLPQAFLELCNTQGV